MKNFLTPVFIFALSLPCLACPDTLTDDQMYIAVVRKAQDADIRAKQAEQEYEKAAAEAKRLHQKLDKADKAYDSAATPEAKQEALNIVGITTDSLIIAVDNAAFAQYRSQIALEELKLANQRAAEFRKKTVRK